MALIFFGVLLVILLCLSPRGNTYLHGHWQANATALHRESNRFGQIADVVETHKDQDRFCLG